MKPEQANPQDAVANLSQSASSDEVGQAPELFSEITLDLVVRAAFELQKLRGREGFEEAEAQGRTDLYFYYLGTEAIRLLFGWVQLLNDRKEGWLGSTQIRLDGQAPARRNSAAGTGG